MRSTSILILPAVLALAACGEGASPSTNAQLTFHVATRSAAVAPGQALLSAPDTQFVGNDTLVLDQVELVLRDIRLKRVEDDACEHESDDGSLQASLHDDGSDDDSGHDGDDDDDACEHFRTGPLLVDLPLGPGVDRVFSVAVDIGTFDELRFKIHKPEDDGSDQADVQFLLDHPDFAGISIRAQGSFNGTPFVWTSDMDADQEQAISPPLAITGGITNVDFTLKVDLDTWFLNGTTLIDPATANKGGPNEQLVEDNVRASFHAFRDDDRDGEDDHDEGHDD